MVGTRSLLPAASIFVLFVAVPLVSYAVTAGAGLGANAACLPYVIPECGCGLKMGKHGCEPDANRFMCDCSDGTNGFVGGAGKCLATGECHANSTNGGSLTDMAQMMQQLQQMLQSMKGGGGGGGGGGGSTPCFSSGTNTGTTSSSANDGCTSFPTTDFTSTTFPPIDTSIFNTPSVSSGISIDTGTPNSGGNSVISSLLDGTISPTGGSTSGGSVVPGGSSTSASSAPPFGSVNGVSGDVRLQGNSVTLLASNRDTARGTQVSGLFGFTVSSGITAVTIFKSMCGLRPWSSSYLALIIPSTYFDSLCTARGYALNARVTGSTAGKSTQSASAQTSSAPAASASKTPTSTPQYLGPLHAEIWAVPASVSLGSRANIFWDAKGVLTCSLSNSDGSFSGSSLSGHASTLPLSKNTTFSIKCMSATSTISDDVVVNVQ